MYNCEPDIFKKYEDKIINMTINKNRKRNSNTKSEKNYVY